MVASRLANLPAGSNQHAEISAPSQSEATDLLNVSRESVVYARKTLDQGSEELIQKVDAGEIVLSAEMEVTSKTANFQDDFDELLITSNILLLVEPSLHCNR